MKQMLKGAAEAVGLGLVRSETLTNLRLIEAECRQVFELVASAHGLQGQSKAQLQQDVFVLLETGFKRNGYFVEFGATNGLDLSNTHLLEKHFGWSGILAEPATIWRDALKANRTAALDFDCVWRTTGETVTFNMVEQPEFSTIQDFNGRDQHSEKRKSGTSYDVKTVSLADLLMRHDAPHEIDYLSIDTEGSEYEILSGFDFDAYRIKIITCEHNFTADRQRIHELLSAKGYERKFPGVSRWDDWYVLR